VVSAVRLGHCPGVRRFVGLLAVFKSNGEGLDGLRGVFAHDGEQRAGIDTGAEKQTDRYIASHLQPHRVFHQALILFDQGILVAAADDLRRPLPVAFHLQPATSR
jgi:hypothetical protein